MRLLLNKRLHVNMGNYEHVEAVATVEVNTETDADILAKYGVDVTEMAEVEEFISMETNRLLAADVEDAAYLTAEEDSFVHEYHKEHTNKKKK